MKNFENDIISSINVFHNGGIILYPTDTIWGIGCDATNATAIKKIYQLKKREEKKSMIILLAHESDIKNYVSNPSKKIIDFISGQKKPTTAIFEKAIHLPKEIISNDGTVAIRIVKDDFCQLLLQHFKKPIVSTSANISGEPHPKNFREINELIKNGADYIVQHRQNDLMFSQPSSIIRLNNEEKIEVIRP
jgi:L-threonylcarbamoyladenylate synthase